MPLRHRRHPALRPVARALPILLLAAACSGGGEAASGAGEGAATGPQPTTSADPNALYADFIECDPLPEGIEYDVPDAVIVPEGMVVTEVSEVGPLVQLTGFIDATPVDVRDRYAEDAQLVYLEDEGFEAEILVDAGDYRTFLKASVRCRTGSVMAVIGAPDDEEGSLPVPGQQAGQ